MRKGHKKGMKEGCKEGIKDGVKMMVRHMLNAGSYALDEIAKTSELSFDEVQQLQAELNP